MNTARILTSVQINQETAIDLLRILREELGEVSGAPSTIGSILAGRRDLMCSILGAAQDILMKQTRIITALTNIAYKK
ncbi:hypothetical protein [Anaerotruncus rubiinfantis]|uniref:hypothetical protein n=1 Tax=Anaerotruncus rubiinfantis TaxID=1720200 RepID=UPI001897D151|nr:hypothetical protein [Anaerotruncus rubiinfantis]